MSLVEDKDDIRNNLAVVDAITTVLRALAYGETVELDDVRLEMQEGLIYIKPWQLVNGEMVDVSDTTKYLGMNHMPWEYWVRVIKKLSPERLNEIKALYAVRAVLNDVKPAKGDTSRYYSPRQWDGK